MSAEQVGGGDETRNTNSRGNDANDGKGKCDTGGRGETGPSTAAPRRIAANPIPYWARDGVVDKSKEIFDEAFRDFADIGFTAVKADLPQGMAVEDYRAWLDSYGLAPAISTVMAPFEDGTHSAGPAGGLVEGGADRLRRFAADQVALGNTETMIIAPMTANRIARPVIAVDHTPEQLERTVELIGEVADILRSEGLRPGIHQHVGSLVESETELTTVLDTLGPDRLGLSPDSGHLSWAGIDPVAMIRRYADRIVGIHLKDVFPDHLAADGTPRDPGAGYHEIGATKRLWAEPGLGVVDLDAVVAALPADFTGDVMIEVDVPSVASRYESHRMSYEWAVHSLAAALNR